MAEWVSRPQSSQELVSFFNFYIIYCFVFFLSKILITSTDPVIYCCKTTQEKVLFLDGISIMRFNFPALMGGAWFILLLILNEAGPFSHFLQYADYGTEI